MARPKIKNPKYKSSLHGLGLAASEDELLVALLKDKGGISVKSLLRTLVREWIKENRKR